MSDTEALKAEIAARIVNYLGKGSLAGGKLTEDLAAMVDAHATAQPVRLELAFGGSGDEQFTSWLRDACRRGGTRAVEGALRLPGPRCWVLVKGYHDGGTIDGVYGPYTEAHADWLLSGPLDGNYSNWTKHKLSSGPEET